MRVLLIFSVVLTSCVVNAQELIRGMVADSATFSPLPYATVRIKNINKGTHTDSQGNFSITATPNDTLVFSLIGYDTVELPVLGWEPSMILLAEKVTMLQSITIHDTYLENPYEGMFDEENIKLRQLNRSLPFYYSKARKQKVRVGRLKNENMRVQTYVDVVVKNEQLRKDLMTKHSLTEDEYYDLLTDFNGKNYSVMYYLTAPELLSLLNNFFARNAPVK